MSAVEEYLDKSTLLILFEEIQSKILADVSTISEVVIFSNQESNEAEQRPFTYPYVSVQMVIDWEPNEARGSNADNPSISGLHGLQSKGNATIIIHTMFGNRNDDTKVFTQNEAIRHSVHRAVHLHYLDPFFTRLIKVQDQLPIEIDGNQDFQTTYVCAVKEGALIIGTADTINEFGIDDGRPDLTIP